MNRRFPSAADYAAVALAPLLIFLMLSSLAGFLVVLLYHGPFVNRVAYTLLMYTMGTVAIARVSIENSRAYSIGYACALGVAALFTMLRFVGDPIFSVLILVVLGVLADRIVQDCTVIDDEVDSSGRGLIDSIASLFTRSSPTPSESTIEGTKFPNPAIRGRAGHHPGRTVLLLALAALPLFGIGQFFLRDNGRSWHQARWFLTLYLFSSCSLLVVTSFLNLRRYLRQRQSEMPRQVTLTWLAGGLGMVAAILVLAHLAPLPGRTVASLEVPKFLSDASEMTASAMGWGEESGQADDKGDRQSGTEPGNSEGQTDQESEQPKQPGGAPEGNRSKSGAPPGGSKGERDDGPAGDSPGGKKSADKSDKESESADQQDAEKSESDSESAALDPPGSTPESSEPESQAEDSAAEPSSREASEQPTPASKATPPAPPQPTVPSASSFDWMGIIVGLLKWLIFAGCLGIVAFYLWQNWGVIERWWRGLFPPPPGQPMPISPSLWTDERVPPRSFASFRNPVGKLDDNKAVVITFDALVAWGNENGVTRHQDETPSEFSQRLTHQFPLLSSPTSQLVNAYNRIVYGRDVANSADIQAVATIWETLENSDVR